MNNMNGSSDIANRMPVLFLGHGSPMNAIEENEFVAGFRKAGIGIPEPTAVLCISAHWETRGTFITAMKSPKTIHDFGGFPKELYAVQYRAPGKPGLAREIKSMIKTTEAGLDESWGLDHGCWSVVKHLFPDAHVPVLQLSLDHYKAPQFHYDLAKELSHLRKKGVLIVGSGNMVHNLDLVAWDRLDEKNFGFEWAVEANEKMKRYILNGDHGSLINYRSQGKEFKLAIPTAEHFLPLLYALALKEDDEKVSLFNDKLTGGSLSMTSVKIEKT